MSRSAIMNERRHVAGAAVQVATARADLAALGLANVPRHLLRTAEARLGYPNDSLTQLGVRLGMTKNAVAGRLRRLHELAQRKAGTS